MWRRSEEELRGGEPLDDAHDSAAEGTVPWRVSGGRGRGGRAVSVLLWLLEQVETEWKKFCAPPIGKEAEVADAHEAAWQDVKQEATQELICWQAHSALLVAVGGIPPSERDAAVGEGKQPVVGNGDAMCVGTEIT
jgi:hypothetical protein